MRRTTICRSSRVAWVVVVGLALAPTLAAQDTTTTAPAGGHVVVSGETLWGIAQQQFADPLLWPEIYRRNTSVIEDPHWIYPGEVLDIGGIAGPPTVAVEPQPQDTMVGADTIAALPAESGEAVMPAPPPPPVAEGPGTIFDRRASQRQRVQDVLRAYAHQVYKPVRPGEFYSSGWLTEDEKLPWARVIGNTAELALPVMENPAVAGQFAEISVVPPKRASYHVGDSLLIARLDRKIEGWGAVVVPVGVARVTAVQEKQVLAEVIMQFGRIHRDNLALPLEPFTNPGDVRPVPVDQGLQGHFIAMRDEHVLAGEQQVLFIDKGRSDGVVPGDVFELYRPSSGKVGARSEEVRMELLVVHTREHSCSALVVGVQNPALEPGMPVRLIKKMPS